MQLRIGRFGFTLSEGGGLFATMSLQFRGPASRGDGSPFVARLFKTLTVPLLLLLAACGPEENDRTADPDLRTQGPFPLTHRPERLDAVGEHTCRECHAEEFARWARSHHAKANRAVETGLDEAAFLPERQVVEGEETYRLFWREGMPWMAVDGPEGEKEEHLLEGVIAYTPLRQYLTPFPGGKWQTTTAAYDPNEGDWFDVFEGEARVEGEWGHWKGQGMNWNANCAYCHMTEFNKKLTPASGDYHSVWTRQAISCVQCHRGMEEHVATATADDPGTLERTLPPVLAEASCATCHSRRDQLTAEEFRPGDSFHDHFDLSLPEYPGLYYPDGQILDEVFVWGSFRLSRMGQAGVTCMDCHDPHSMEITRPTHNNATCTYCHDTGLNGATVIDPVAHSRHPADSTGNRCVECHMPKTPYMQRDPRADHGFLSPDPLMTREMDIPNACNRCHEEETVEWAEAAVAEWFPEPNILPRHRARARARTAAWEGDPTVATDLLALAEAETVHAWKAAYTGLLGRFPDAPGVMPYLRRSLSDPSSLVRSRATLAVGNTGMTGPRFDRLLDDPTRNVRIAAARSFAARGQPIPDASAAAEWRGYLLFNADRPQSLILLADEAARQGDAEAARLWMDRAEAMEETNPELKRRIAILANRIGDNERAGQLLQDAWAIAPEDPGTPYSLALLRAEEGDLPEAVKLLKVAVRLDPDFHRAWYNLALAQLRVGDPAAAAESLEKAAPGLTREQYRQAARAIANPQQ